ncbi:MAG: hypothetical protein PHC64_09515 [Candidatus Gastranaerophilales bacterium]|nr:hypothetical protein [Candidatus Gastranaerophilales bacterium]
MSIRENASTYFQTKITESINSTSDNAYERMLAKKAEYEAAKTIFDKYQEEYITMQRRLCNNNPNDLKKYYNLKTCLKNTEINVDVLRSSLMSCIFYAAKMNNATAPANSSIFC